MFLAKSKEDILPTIVSRCQTFKLSGQYKKTSYEDILPIISNYGNIQYINSFDISQKAIDYIEDNSITTEEFLNKFIVYLKDLMKQNIDNQEICIKIKNDIDIINTAIKHYRANIKDKIVLDTMFLKLVRGY